MQKNVAFQYNSMILLMWHSSSGFLLLYSTCYSRININLFKSLKFHVNTLTFTPTDVHVHNFHIISYKFIFNMLNVKILQNVNILQNFGMLFKKYKLIFCHGLMSIFQDYFYLSIFNGFLSINIWVIVTLSFATLLLMLGIRFQRL